MCKNILLAYIKYIVVVKNSDLITWLNKTPDFECLRSNNMYKLSLYLLNIVLIFRPDNDDNMADEYVDEEDLVFRQLLVDVSYT